MIDSGGFRTAVPIAFAAALGGCTLPPPSGCMSEPDAAQALVIVPDEIMGPAARRVRFADPREFDEYVLYRGSDGERLEAVYLETRWKHGRNVVLNFFEPIDERVLGFAYNAGTQPAFQESQRLDTAFGGMWLRPYRHPVTGQQCAGFMETWDERADDPEFRPSKAIYGYYCAAQGTTDLAAANRVLSRLEAGLRTVEAGAGGPGCENAGIRSTRPEGSDILARGKASGAAGKTASAGDVHFPPVRAVPFHEHNGRDDWE